MTKHIYWCHGVTSHLEWSVIKLCNWLSALIIHYNLDQCLVSFFQFPFLTWIYFEIFRLFLQPHYMFSCLQPGWINSNCFWFWMEGALRKVAPFFLIATYCNRGHPEKISFVLSKLTKRGTPKMFNQMDSNSIVRKGSRDMGQCTVTIWYAVDSVPGNEYATFLEISEYSSLRRKQVVMYIKSHRTSLFQEIFSFGEKRKWE